MKTLPQNPSESTKRRNPSLWSPTTHNPTGKAPLVNGKGPQDEPDGVSGVITPPGNKTPYKANGRIPKPLLNGLENRWHEVLAMRGCGPILKQAITLRLDPPFKSYTPDLAYTDNKGLVLVEVKGCHRFRRAGIAKAALAAKTYPCFRFELADWNGKEWKETVL